MRFRGTVEPGHGGRHRFHGGPGAHALRQASQALSTWSPRLERDLEELAVEDWGDLASPEAADGLRLGFLGAEWPREVLRAKAFVSVSGGIHSHAPRGTEWHLGARAYDRAARDRARRDQRLLPVPEVDLVLAARTAAAEIGPDLPVHLDLDLDVLHPLGATAGELWQALHVLSALRLESFAVLAGERDAALGAELVRDLTLMAWGPASA